MIRRLTEKDEKLVKRFANERERENLFVLGSLKNYENTFRDNNFWGYFDGDKLIGLATLFGRWGSFVVNAQDQGLIEELTDEAVTADRKIEHVPCFKQYADVIIERLKSHGIVPKSVRQETVFTLKEGDFVDFSTRKEKVAEDGDLDEIILFDRIIDGESVDKPIQDFERKRINVKETFILKVDGMIVSKANPHGVSKNYFQIGGVGTLEEYRGRGYAKRVVSELCRYYFDQGIKCALLFTSNVNQAAQRVYTSLGFKPDGKFVIADY